VTFMHSLRSPRTAASRLVAILLVVALMIAADGCAGPDQLTTALGSYDMTQVNHFLAMAAPAAGGIALVIVKDGIVVEDSGYGRFGSGTVVDVGTSSRWLAAAAMMTLVDQGTLNLDDPASKYLPEFIGDKATITVRQLWSCTSGLPDTDTSLSIRSLTLAECVRRIASGPLPSVPGTSVGGGAVGIQVGARICEVISGMTWQNFFRTRIAEPLGMTSTTFDMMGFSRNPFVAGSARSTAEDYAKFLLMFLQKGVWSGKRILSEQSVAEIEQDQAPAATVVTSPYAALTTLLPKTRQARPGLGAWQEEADPASGKLLIASCPGDKGFMPWIDIHLNLVAVLSMESDVSAAAYSIMNARQLVPQAIAAGRRFKDVPATSWAFAAVNDLSSQGLIAGYEDGMFHPDSPVTRAEFANLICAALGAQPAVVTADPFNDVLSDYWAAGSIVAAVRKGWFTGYPGSLFKPEEPVSMAQALAVIARSQNWSNAAELPYADVQPGYWAHALVQACYAEGIVRNPDPGIVVDGKLNPDSQCSRAQACVLISRLLGTGIH
jgi:CubicO group peptidase (beta-lactamase class C family)